ncbi:STAS domain-containing protein, partial [Kaarinaea lacus]
MGLSAKQSTGENEVIIQIEGRFDFHMHASFQDLYSQQPPTSTFVIDLAKATYIDSSAMGMLLLLREYAGKDRNKIRLINSPPEVKRALSISNLDQLFLID